MPLNPAVEAEYPAIIDLANLAFRGTGPSASWNTEADFIAGPRLSESLLRADLAAKPEAHLLTYRDDLNSPLLGTVLLDPKQNGLWYLGAHRIQMTVVNVRATLIAWYERRGYTVTSETRPFPYGDDRFGKPLRNDLHFVVLEKDI
jgi:hypothetical protein